MCVCVCVCVFIYEYIERERESKGEMESVCVCVCANDPENWGLIPGRVIPKTQKTVLDATLFNNQHQKVRIKGKMEQSKERSGTLL